MFIHEQKGIFHGNIAAIQTDQGAGHRFPCCLVVAVFGLSALSIRPSTVLLAGST